MQEQLFVVYGTGSGARQVIENNTFSFAAAVSPNEIHGEKFFHGLPVFNDSFLLNIEQNFSLVIASQYFDIIHARLTNEGKLSNPHLKEVLVPNLLGQRAPCDENDTLSVTEGEYAYLFSLLHDENSLRLLTIIKKERTSPSYPSVRYIPFQKGIFHAGIEDYWHSVKPTRKHEKSVVIDAGAYIGDSISSIVENIGGGVQNYCALEPIKATFDILKNVNPSSVDNFSPVNAALGDVCTKAFVSNNGENYDASSIEKDYKENAEEINIITLDSMALNDDADYFLKMDVEGSELKALRGGVNFIKNKQPNLAICLYHKDRDLIDIPKFVDELCPNVYDFYLVGGSHTIMIAKPH